MASASARQGSRCTSRCARNHTRTRTLSLTNARTAAQEQVRKIVLACGGAFDDDFALGTTTHLVADAVGSQKHRVRQSSCALSCARANAHAMCTFVCLFTQAAVAHSLPVATPKWIFESFRAHALLDVSAYALRALEGLVVCTTGLAAQSRDQVERMAVVHGATYDPNLEVGYTSVLIAQRPGGAKYDACVSYGIPVVHVSWLHACVESATLLDEREFALEKVLRPSRLFAHVQTETAQVLSQLPALVRRYRQQDTVTLDDDDNDEDDWMALFDSCGVHLVGFPPALEASLQHLLRTAMGTIYYDFTPALVTHVVVSPSLRDTSALTLLEDAVARDSADGHVHFVSPKWLLDSVKCLRLEPEELYPVEVDAEHELPAPGPLAPGATYAADVSMVDASYDQLPDVHADDASGDVEADSRHTEPLGAPPDDDLSHEPQTPTTASPTSERGLFRDCAFLVLCRDPDDRHVVRPMVKQIQSESAGQAIPLDARDVGHLDVGQFAFITHVVLCAGVALDPVVAHELEQQIVSLKATTASASSPRARGRARRERLTFVSDLWVRCCLAAGVKLSHQAHELFALTLHQPRSLFAHSMPLAYFASVRASTSVYVGVDRIVVLELLRLAGAQTTSKLSKRNTHLICLKPIGMKFDKAREWGVAVVTARWVIQSMVHGALLDVTADEFQVSEHSGDAETNGDGDATGAEASEHMAD